MYIYFADSCSNQIALVAVVCSVASALVTLVICSIVFRLWYRNQISKSKQPICVTEISKIHSVGSRNNAGNADYEIPLDEMSAVAQDTQRSDITEYQELGEREMTSTPSSYQTIRAL